MSAVGTSYWSSCALSYYRSSCDPSWESSQPDNLSIDDTVADIHIFEMASEWTILPQIWYSCPNNVLEQLDCPLVDEY